MSNVDTKSIVDEVIQNIDSNLSALNSPATEAEINAALRGPIEAAFTAARAGLKFDSDERNAANKALYRALSLKLHPDKLEQSKASFVAHLKRLSPEEDNSPYLAYPQATLEDFKVDANDDFIKPLDMSQYHPRAVFTRAQNAAQPLFNKYLEYSEFARNCVLCFRSSLFIALNIAGAVLFFGSIYLTASMTPLWGILPMFHYAPLNFITEGHYDEVLNQSVTEERMAAFARNVAKQIGQESQEDWSDEDVIAFFIAHWRSQKELSEPEYFDFHSEDDIAREGREVLKALVKEEIRVRPLLHLGIVFESFAAAIKAPLPKTGWVLPGLTALLRGIQMLLVLPWLLVDVIAQAWNHGVFFLGFMKEVSVFLAKLAVTLLLDTPLYAQDAVSSVYQGCKSMFFSKPEVKPDANMANDVDIDMQEGNLGAASVGGMDLGID